MIITDSTTSFSNIQPLPYQTLYKRYNMNIRSGTIYDMEEKCIAPTYQNKDGILTVDLIDSEGSTVVALVEDLLIRMLYGPVNGSSMRHVCELPCDTAALSPEIWELKIINEREIRINDVKYLRWKDSFYYLSAHGSAFSKLMGRFFRIHYNEKGYAQIAIKLEGKSISKRLQRMMWETFRGEIPSDKEIDHINDLRWDNRIENFQLLTHLENLQKKDPANHRTLSFETKVGIANDLISGMRAIEISKKWNVPPEVIWRIRNRAIFTEELSDYQEELSKIGKDRPLTPDIVREIRRLRNDENKAVKDISSAVGVGSGTIYHILQGAAYADIT